MPTNPSVILLFEDDFTIVKDFEKKLKPKLGKALELVVFPLDQPSLHDHAPYDARVEEWVRSSGFYDRLVLIVTDHDLSANSDCWRGLSQSAVSGAAKQLGIPVAGYRRAKVKPEVELKRIPGDGLIDLDPDLVRRAEQVATLAKGFIELEKRVTNNHAPETGNSSRKRSAQMHISSPGALLAKVLDHPSTAGHFDTFACGDQVAIGEILSFSHETGKLPTHVRRRLIAALGVWLSDLVMRYPGVLVNKVAAASYLDIHTEDFSQTSVQRLFARARYKDLPFEDKAEPLWWRHVLDEILAEAECSSGLQLTEKKGIEGIRYCPCSVDSTLHAGYYCMASHDPISGEKSSGRVRWFPPGADLARLKASTYRRLAPWIGT